MIQAKFGLNWPSGFRGEDFWKSLQTDAGRQVMAIAHMTLWVRWANKTLLLIKQQQWLSKFCVKIDRVASKN